MTESARSPEEVVAGQLAPVLRGYVRELAMTAALPRGIAGIALIPGGMPDFYFAEFVGPGPPPLDPGLIQHNRHVLPPDNGLSYLLTSASSGKFSLPGWRLQGPLATPAVVRDPILALFGRSGPPDPVVGMCARLHGAKPPLSSVYFIPASFEASLPHWEQVRAMLPLIALQVRTDILLALAPRSETHMVMMQLLACTPARLTGLHEEHVVRSFSAINAQRARLADASASLAFEVDVVDSDASHGSSTPKVLVLRGRSADGKAQRVAEILLGRVTRLRGPGGDAFVRPVDAAKKKRRRAWSQERVIAYFLLSRGLDKADRRMRPLQVPWKMVHDCIYGEDRVTRRGTSSRDGGRLDSAEMVGMRVYNPNSESETRKRHVNKTTEMVQRADILLCNRVGLDGAKLIDIGKQGGETVYEFGHPVRLSERAASDDDLARLLSEVAGAEREED